MDYGRKRVEVKPINTYALAKAITVLTKHISLVKKHMLNSDEYHTTVIIGTGLRKIVV